MNAPRPGIDRDRLQALLASPNVSSAQRAEVFRFADEVESYRNGDRSLDDFRALRLENGVYGIRFEQDVHMVRVKVRFGVLTAAQLETLGLIADDFANGVAHVTTRQDVQFYWVPRERVPELLAHLSAVGLTTREACGNTVRNVTCCPEAGVCAFEPFDVTPYADALSAHFLRNPLCQNLPRKFKIAFSGCPEDCAFTAIHDLGFLAAVQEAGDGSEARGFEVYVGGGLGSTPKAAQRLETFLPATDLLICAEAVLRIFDRMGNRKERHRARLKFLVEQLGLDGFKRLYETEKRLARQTRPGSYPMAFPEEERIPEGKVAEHPVEPRPEYATWFRTNVKPQKQDGFVMVYVLLPAGDLTSDQFRQVARLAGIFANGKVRTTPRQNLLLRWVRRESLPALHATLEDVGLGRSGANHVGDIVGCPGADTCNLAITKSHQLARVLLEKIAARPDLALAEDLKDIHIKVSGCPNACGHHHIATLGLYGGARRVRGRPVPHYRLLVGGDVGRGKVKFGRPIAEIPAKHVPAALLTILETYRERRGGGESFGEWLQREGRESTALDPDVAADGGEVQTMEREGSEGKGIAAVLQRALAEFQELPPYDEAPDLYRDWGDRTDFRLKTGRGECAGP